jgi:hypothetical protein
MSQSKFEPSFYRIQIQRVAAKRACSLVTMTANIKDFEKGDNDLFQVTITTSMES